MVSGYDRHELELLKYLVKFGHFILGKFFRGTAPPHVQPRLQPYFIFSSFTFHHRLQRHCA